MATKILTKIHGPIDGHAEINSEFGPMGTMGMSCFPLHVTNKCNIQNVRCW